MTAFEIVKLAIWIAGTAALIVMMRRTRRSAQAASPDEPALPSEPEPLRAAPSPGSWNGHADALHPRCTIDGCGCAYIGVVSLDGVTYLAGVHRRLNTRAKCEHCFEAWPCAPMRSLDRHIDEQIAKPAASPVGEVRTIHVRGCIGCPFHRQGADDSDDPEFTDDAGCGAADYCAAASLMQGPPRPPPVKIAGGADVDLRPAWCPLDGGPISARPAEPTSAPTPGAS